MARTIAEGRNQIGQTGIRKLHTNVWKGDDYFQVQLYSTVVYDEHPEYLTLRNGGWPTPTTVSRINQALRYRGFKGGVVIRDRRMMFVNGPRQVPFVNGEVTLQLHAGQVA